MGKCNDDPMWGKSERVPEKSLHINEAAPSSLAMPVPARGAHAALPSSVPWCALSSYQSTSGMNFNRWNIFANLDWAYPARDNVHHRLIWYRHMSTKYSPELPASKEYGQEQRYWSKEPKKDTGVGMYQKLAVYFNDYFLRTSETFSMFTEFI